LRRFRRELRVLAVVWLALLAIAGAATIVRAYTLPLGMSQMFISRAGIGYLRFPVTSSVRFDAEYDALDLSAYTKRPIAHFSTLSVIVVIP